MKKEEKKKYEAAKANFIKTSQQSIFMVLEKEKQKKLLSNIMKLNPKEQAQELIDKFASIKPIKMSDYSSIMYPTAKQCALIAVQYIINANPHSNPFNTEVHSTMEYWQAVKEEIENL